MGDDVDSLNEVITKRCRSPRPAASEAGGREGDMEFVRLSGGSARAVTVCPLVARVRRHCTSLVDKSLAAFDLPNLSSNAKSQFGKLPSELVPFLAWI